MIIFTYDKTFEGLLTCIFEAYYRKLFPDILLPEQSPLPLFYDSLTRIFTGRDTFIPCLERAGEKIIPGRTQCDHQLLVVRISRK